MNKEYKFSLEELESQIGSLEKKGITELCVNDSKIATDKRRLISLINKIQAKEPQIFVSLCVQAQVIDKEVVQAASTIFCSFEIPLECSNKGGKLLFDKKFYANKARLLNDYGLVFGFSLTYAQEQGDTLKLFMERLDFAVQQYPNHIDFPQTENDLIEAKVSGCFSAQDIRYCRDVAFSCRTFYSAGRAVPWFLSVLKPLKIYPSKLFADFSEWQRVNNCDFKSGFVPESEKHEAIQKMQLLFLEQKLEEKNQKQYWQLVQDIVNINGAFARLTGEGTECVVKTQYHPDDLLSPEALSLEDFMENVCMLPCSVKIFFSDEGPDYQVM